jgi:putative PIN family toxin of toxin-antitoxin system
LHKTIVIISSFATRGLCHSVFEICLDRFEIIISSTLIKELRNALKRKLKLPELFIVETLDYLSENATSVEVNKLISGVCRDPEDDHIIALADSAGANYIITGDEDLLILKKYGSTQIVTPRQFWQLSKK